MRVLVAEDDPNLRELLRIILEHERGDSVDVVTNGYEAVHKASHETYDLIILDGKMPQLTGLEALRVLQSRVHPLPPVIFLSAHSETEFGHEFLDSGAGFIQKPLDPVSLCRKIEEFLATCQAPTQEVA